jgi:hypothetical protein
MNNKMEIYNEFRQVPKEAQKTIGAGRLKGFTDINPQWRIQALTEMFGACGFGWKYTITDKRIIEGADGVSCAFVDIDLYIKVDDQWSEAIPGTGGSSFVASERNGLYTSDECFKMALTDAISVACKALGIGADVYWAEGKIQADHPAQKPPKEKPPRDRLIAKLKEMGINVTDYAKEKGLSGQVPDSRFEELLKELG